MKKIIYIVSACAFFSMTSGNLYGQEIRLADGLLFSDGGVRPTQVARMSYTGGIPFGTARSTAMGGAFTSLGADLSSMHINPAGLGMYQSSEFAVTPMMTFSKVSNTDPFYISNGKNKKSRFSLSNVGAAMNMYQGGGNLTSFTLGFGYNRLTDFNTNNYMSLGYSDGKLADIFVDQLNTAGISARELEYYPDRYYDIWGAFLAHNSKLVQSTGNNQYAVNGIGSATKTDQHATVNTRGSIGEYNISAGFNLRNKLYLGFSIGIQDIYYKQTIFYDEYFHDNNSSAAVKATQMLYENYMKIEGYGVNLKFGAIYRPTEELRIGLSVHTPTWATVNHYYERVMETGLTAKPVWTPENELEYNYSTPTRLLGGVSYTFGSFGVLSVDYERTWYNSMRLREGDRGFRNYFNDTSKNNYKGNNTIRVGGEARPFDSDISLRAGFTYTDYMTDIPSDRIYDSAVPQQSFGASAGVGFRIGRTSYLDFTYAYNNTKYSDYYVYKYKHRDVDYQGANPTQTVDRHAVMASLGIRF